MKIPPLPPNSKHVKRLQGIAQNINFLNNRRDKSILGKISPILSVFEFVFLKNRLNREVELQMNFDSVFPTSTKKIHFEKSKGLCQEGYKWTRIILFGKERL